MRSRLVFSLTFIQMAFFWQPVDLPLLVSWRNASWRHFRIGCHLVCSLQATILVTLNLFCFLINLYLTRKSLEITSLFRGRPGQDNTPLTVSIKYNIPNNKQETQSSKKGRLKTSSNETITFCRNMEF